MSPAENVNSKWILRSRQVWTVLSVALFAITAACRQLGLELPAGIEDSVDGLVQTGIGFAAAVLATWSMLRPDNAKLTLAPKKTNMPLGAMKVLPGAATIGALFLLACTIAMEARSYDVVMAVAEHPFEFNWTPSANATHYEVIEEVYAARGPVNEQSLLNSLASLVAEPIAFVSPGVGEMHRIRVRGMKGEAIPNGDCPFQVCGTWSEWSDVLVARINSPDLDGDTYIGVEDYGIFVPYYGKCVDGWRIVRCPSP